MATRCSPHATARRRWRPRGSTLPDLVLLDVMMPRLDGIEACRRLKADRPLPFMPVVMVTAKAEAKDVVAGLDAGADEYLTKPVDHCGAGGPSALDAAHQGPARHRAGAGSAARARGTASSSSGSPSRWTSSSGSAGCGGSSRRSWPSDRRVGRRGAPAEPPPRGRRSCSATCAASPPSPRRPTPRR